MVEIDDEDDNDLTREYRYSFEHLCPTNPPPAVLDC